MIFLHAFGGVFSLLLVVALGYILSSRGWFSPAARTLIPRLVNNISLPPFLACTIITSFKRDQLMHMAYGAFLPFIAMCLLFLLAYATGRLLKVDKKHFGLFCACVSNPNTIFIGIPVNMALFGPESISFVLLYYFASTFFFWTVGNYFISRDFSPGRENSGSGFQWRKIISAPIFGFIFGLLVICADMEPPEFIMSAAGIIGSLTTPLALIFIGITLQVNGLTRIRPSRDMGIALAGRLILSPILLWLLLPLFHLPELMGNVFVIQSSLPVLMQVAILSAYYKTDPEFGSVMVSLSTVLCVITIPVYMVLLHL